MTTLTLKRVGPGRYALGELGTLLSERRFGARIEAGGEAWRLRRALAGFGQTIVATDAAGGDGRARYVPHGFLHLRGIYAGEVRLAERVLGWRANHQLGRRFTLSENGGTIASFEALGAATPVRLEIADPTGLAPLELLFCCHVVKQAVDTAAVGAAVGAGTAAAGAGS